MARHIEAWMDGVRLSSLGRILIHDVDEPAADQEITYGNRSVRGGKDVLVSRRGVLRVTIEAVVFELFDLSRRREAQQAIAEWANGSILELSNHPGQQLHVRKRGDPALGSVRDFNSKINIELEAAEIPYWEETITNKATGSGSSGSASLFLSGNADEIPVNAVFTPTGGTLTGLTVTVSCGGVTRSIQLSGISVGTSSAVVFGRDGHDRLTIKAGSTSLMRYRTQASADELILPHGKATVSWSANVAGSIEFSAKGRWL